jgi:hypothetical protein
MSGDVPDVRSAGRADHGRCWKHKSTRVGTPAREPWRRLRSVSSRRSRVQEAGATPSLPESSETSRLSLRSCASSNAVRRRAGRQLDQGRPRLAAGARDTGRWRTLCTRRASVEGHFGRLKHQCSLPLLRVHGLERVRLHADLTILAKLACASQKPEPHRSRRKSFLKRRTGPAGIPCASESVASARCSRFGSLCSLGAGVDGRRASSTSVLLSGRKSERVSPWRGAGCLGPRDRAWESRCRGLELRLSLRPRLRPDHVDGRFARARSNSKETRQAARNPGRPAGATGPVREHVPDRFGEPAGDLDADDLLADFADPLGGLVVARGSERPSARGGARRSLHRKPHPPLVGLLARFCAHAGAFHPPRSEGVSRSLA